MKLNIFKKSNNSSKTPDKKFDPNEYDSIKYYEMAFERFKSNDFGSAILDCDKAIELNPNYSSAYSLRGRAKYEITFLKVRNDRKLISDILERIKSEHDKETLYKEYRDSLNDFNKAIEINPNDALTYRERAILKMEIKDFESTLKDLELAVKLNSSIKERILLDLQKLKIDWDNEIAYNKIEKK